MRCLSQHIAQQQCQWLRFSLTPLTSTITLKIVSWLLLLLTLFIWQYKTKQRNLDRVKTWICEISERAGRRSACKCVVPKIYRSEAVQYCSVLLGQSLTHWFQEFQQLNLPRGRFSRNYFLLWPSAKDQETAANIQIVRGCHCFSGESSLDVFPAWHSVIQQLVNDEIQVIHFRFAKPIT